MSRRAYPRIGNSFRPWRMKNPPKTERAKANVAKEHGFCPCGAPATGTVVIQYDWFRGNDDTERRCDAHKNDAAVEAPEHPPTCSPLESMLRIKLGTDPEVEECQ